MNETRLDVMKRSALVAGEFMLGGAAMHVSHQKTGAKDFVTVADIKSQDVIRQELSKVFPDAVILSEEDDETARAALYEPDFTGYVLDPIDGTYNFKRDMRESAISIGYVEHGVPMAGVIYDPYKQELFTVEKGSGAFRNDRPIQVSTQTDLHGASVATSNGYDDAAAARNLKRQIGIYEQSGIMPWTSCPGSAVLVMAWIACGRIDALHHYGLKPWDNAAAFLLVQEAGGIIETLDGQEPTFTSPGILIGTPAIQTQLRTIFQQLPAELLQ